jgi:hypothetical protein
VTIAYIALRECNLAIKKRLERFDSDDYGFVLFSEEGEVLPLSDDPLVSDEPDDGAALEEPLAPLLALAPLGLLSDFSPDPSLVLPALERA